MSRDAARAIVGPYLTANLPTEKAVAPKSMPVLIIPILFVKLCILELQVFGGDAGASAIYINALEKWTTTL